MTTSPTTTTLSQDAMARLAEQAKIQAKAVLGKIPLLGPVAWLMMQSGPTRHVWLGDLEWRVMPALVLDQAKLYLRDGAPLAFVSWARLSPEAADRYCLSPHRLAPTDWKSGPQVWIVDLLAPFGGGHEVIEDLRSKVFPGETLRQFVSGETSAPNIVVYEGKCTGNTHK